MAMRLGCRRKNWILISLASCPTDLSLSSCVAPERLSLFITFIAATNPLARCFTRNTSPNRPVPSFLSTRNSLKREYCAPDPALGLWHIVELVSRSLGKLEAFSRCLGFLPSRWLSWMSFWLLDSGEFLQSNRVNFFLKGVVRSYRLFLCVLGGCCLRGESARCLFLNSCGMNLPLRAVSDLGLLGRGESARSRGGGRSALLAIITIK